MTYLLAQASAHRIPLRDESVQTCVTSPPYWALRQYSGEQGVKWSDGTTHPLGLEPTPDLFVAHMVEVFREVWRVLRKDGTLWLNLGDSYAGSWGNQGRKPERGTQREINGPMLTPVLDGRYPSKQSNTGAVPAGLKPKDLVGIPWRVALALQADGWYLRSDIVWSKPNPMPESVTDRPTKAHEYVFLMSKSDRYFYDADAVRELGAGREVFGNVGSKQELNADRNDGGRRDMTPTAHRNMRTVWQIATQPYPGAHFATFPEALPERCIKAGSAAQACGVCGAPWERVTEHESGDAEAHERPKRTAGMHSRTSTLSLSGNGSKEWAERGAKRTTLGFRPTCEHDDGSSSSVVLDPFNGSGTTGRVALSLGRRYIGLDMSREYLTEQAIARIDPITHTHRTTDQMAFPL